jgi:hypothetical protein
MLPKFLDLDSVMGTLGTPDLREGFFTGSGAGTAGEVARALFGEGSPASLFSAATTTTGSGTACVSMIMH